MKLAGIILISVACMWVTAIAGSLETLLLTHAVSLLTGGLLLHDTQSDQHPLMGEGKKSWYRSLIEQMQSRRVMGALSFICVALAFALLSALGGGTSLEQIEATLHASYRPERAELIVGDGSILGVAAVILLFVGCAPQFGVFPLHGVMMNGFDTAPAGVAGFASIQQRAQSAMILWKVAVVTLSGFESTVLLMCIVFGVSSCVAGAILACRSESLRSFAGNLWMTWGGLALISVATGHTTVPPADSQIAWQLPTGMETAVFSLLISSVAIAMLLACDRWLTLDKRPVDFAEDVTGLGHQHGLIAAAMTCSLLTLCAIPPLPGFWCVLFLTGNAFLPGVESMEGAALIPDASVLLATVLMLVSLVILASRSVRIMSLMFHHEPIRRFQILRERTSAGISLAVVGLLLWAGINVGTVLALIHELPL